MALFPESDHIGVDGLCRFCIPRGGTSKGLRKQQYVKYVGKVCRSKTVGAVRGLDECDFLAVEGLNVIIVAYRD